MRASGVSEPDVLSMHPETGETTTGEKMASFQKHNLNPEELVTVCLPYANPATPTRRRTPFYNDEIRHNPVNKSIG